MSRLYRLTVVTDFAAAHSLRDYPGECSRLHGHNWKVEVEVSARHLDNAGMAIDFKVIKRHTKDLLGRLDHYNLNDVPPFDQINPTAENIAAYIYRHLSDQLNNDRLWVSAVTLWETERAAVRYSEERPL